MCCCCCPNLHRHQIHLISYGCVSFCLITTGLVFTIFAVFQKDSQIGKIWLAGPTTMVVGLVLCGKVIIDWGPAMAHAREGSIDAEFNQEDLIPGINPIRLDAQLPAFKNPLTSLSEPATFENSRHAKMNGVDGVKAYSALCNTADSNCIGMAPSEHIRSYEGTSSFAIKASQAVDRSALRRVQLTGERLAFTRMTAPHAHQKRSSLPRNPHRCRCAGAEADDSVALLNHSSHNEHQASSSLYGALATASCAAHSSFTNLYQGEMFVLNNRSYLI